MSTNPYALYVPSLASGIAFVTVFAIFLTFHLLISLRYFQRRFFIYWSFGLICQILGFAGRIWITKNDFNVSAHIFSSVCTSLAPSFFLAGLYYISGEVFKVFGSDFIYLNISLILLILKIANVTAGILQGVGSGLITNYDSLKVGTNVGLDLIVAGLAFQVLTLTCFQILWYVFIYKVRQSKHQFNNEKFDKNYQHITSKRSIYYLFITFSFAIAFMFIRSIYRLIEMSEGLLSVLATKEIYYNLLDGMMIALVCLVISIIPPSILLGKKKINDIEGNDIERNDNVNKESNVERNVGRNVDSNTSVDTKANADNGNQTSNLDVLARYSLLFRGIRHIINSTKK